MASRRELRDQLNDRWLELVDEGYEIDLGSKWRGVLLKTKFGSLNEHRSDLRYGVADRVGYELLRRPVQRTILSRRPTGEERRGNPAPGGRRVTLKPTIGVVDEVSGYSYEPVPIETVLWDGQGSSSSSQADYLISGSLRRREPRIRFTPEAPRLTPLKVVGKKPSAQKTGVASTAATKSTAVKKAAAQKAPKKAAQKAPKEAVKKVVKKLVKKAVKKAVKKT